MRYRPFGPHGMVVSAMALRLTDAVRWPAETWTRAVYAALECGVNCFEIAARHPAAIEGLSQALQAIDRHLVVIAWRVGRLPANSQPVQNFSAAALNGQVRAILARTGLEYLDVALLDDPRAEELPREGLDALIAMKQAGAARMIGVAGDDDALADYICTGKFDVLAAPYNLNSGWRERLWLRAAAERDMAVIGHQAYPEDFHRAASAAHAQRGKGATALSGIGGYGFLDHTHGWTAEEICLAYALTEPALATVTIDAVSWDVLETLCRIADREMPPGLSAQIEMARFSPAPQAAARTA